MIKINVEFDVIYVRPVDILRVVRLLKHDSYEYYVMLNINGVTEKWSISKEEYDRLEGMLS